jgi:hypothetical protein
MTRRFVTRSAVDAAVARGETSMDLSGTVTVTDEAAARARERGLVFVRDGVVVAGRPTPASAVGTGAAPGEPAPTRSAGPADPGAPAGPVDRAAVRRAVVATLGRVPPELDAVLDRVLGGVPGQASER